MATNQERLDQLEQLLYSGSTSTTIDGETVQFRDQSEILDLIGYLKSNDPTLAGQTKTAPFNASLEFRGIY